MAVSEADLKRLQDENAQLIKRNQESEQRVLQAELKEARVRAVRDFPLVEQGLLDEYQGSPEQVYAYAKRLHEWAQARIPVAPPASPPIGSVVSSPPKSEAPPPALVPGMPPAIAPAPAPVPGPGQSVMPETAAQMRKKELHEKIVAKSATAAELTEAAGLSIWGGIREHQQKIWGRRSP